MTQRLLIECERQHPSLFVPSVSDAVEFYKSRLGFDVGFPLGEPPTMAGMNLGSVQIFLDCDSHGSYRFAERKA